MPLTHATCPVDGARLVLVSGVNGAGDGIQRYECPNGDWVGTWYPGDAVGGSAVPEVSRTKDTGAGRDDTDNQAAASGGLTRAVSRLYGWDPIGGNWDRLRVNAAGELVVTTAAGSPTGRDDTDNQAPVATGLLTSVDRMYVWDAAGGNWDRWTGAVTGTVAVSNFPATQPVSGTVAVSNFPASVEVSNDVGNPLPVSGAVTISGTPTVSVTGTVAVTSTDFAERNTYHAVATGVTFTSILGGSTIAGVIFHGASSTKTVEIIQIDVSVQTNVNAGASTITLVPVLGTTTPSGGTVLVSNPANRASPAAEATVRSLPATTTLGTGAYVGQGFLLGILGNKTTSDNLVNQPLYALSNYKHQMPLRLRAGVAEGIAFVVTTAVASLQTWIFTITYAES